MAGDVAADVGSRDAGLAAQRRDDPVVDVALVDPADADGEQEVHPLAGLAVQQLGLRRPHGLPCLDGLAQQRVDRLGERGAGLMGGHVQQADRVAGEYLAGVPADGHPVVLPADASHAQPGDLVAALTGKQPGERDRADHLDRVHAAVGGQVGGVEVESGPQQFRPDAVGDHPGVWAQQRAEAARGGQRPSGVEPAGIH